MLQPGGVALVATRDYDAVRAGETLSSTPPQRSLDNHGRRVVTVQLWDWADGGEQCAVTHLQNTEQQAGMWTTRTRSTVYRAWLRDEVLDLARDAGFRHATWLTAAEAAFFQPVLVLRT